MGVNGYLCMVYECFLDDSKDAKQSLMFVSAGFFGTRDDWSSLRRAWNAVLKEKGIEYFKSSEYNHLTHQFANFRTSAYPPPSGRNAAKEIKGALQQVVGRHPFILSSEVLVSRSWSRITRKCVPVPRQIECLARILITEHLRAFHTPASPKPTMSANPLLVN